MKRAREESGEELPASKRLRRTSGEEKQQVGGEEEGEEILRQLISEQKLPPSVLSLIAFQEGSAATARFCPGLVERDPTPCFQQSPNDFFYSFPPYGFVDCSNDCWRALLKWLLENEAVQPLQIQINQEDPFERLFNDEQPSVYILQQIQFPGDQQPRWIWFDAKSTDLYHLIIRQMMRHQLVFELEPDVNTVSDILGSILAHGKFTTFGIIVEKNLEKEWQMERPARVQTWPESNYIPRSLQSVPGAHWEIARTPGTTAPRLVSYVVPGQNPSPLAFDELSDVLQEALEGFPETASQART